MDLRKAASAATQSQSSQNLNNPSEVWTSGKLGPEAGAWPSAERGTVGVNRARRVSIGHSGPCQCVLRIEHGRAFVILHGSLRRHCRELVPEVATTQVEVIGFHLPRLAMCEHAKTFGYQLQSNVL